MVTGQDESGTKWEESVMSSLGILISRGADVHKGNRKPETSRREEDRYGK